MATVRQRVKNKLLAGARTLRVASNPRLLYLEVSNKLRSSKRLDGVIVTLTVYNNYGNVIQRYALQQFLAKNGYRFGMLDLHNSTPNKNHVNLRIFVKKYLTQEKFSIKKSARHSAYIVGSDQVWRHFSINKTWNQFGIQFLHFVKNESANRIAYAASFGVDTLEEAGINEWHQKMIKPLMKKFNAVSVRENSGRGLAKKLGAGKVAQVLDPTLLLNARDYEQLIERAKLLRAQSEKVFFYLIQQTPLTESAIEYYTHETDGGVYGILPYERGVKLPSVETWLNSIRNAEFVVTDSYHALVFSIIFHTDFIVFDKSLGGLARIKELLEPLGLEDRIVIQGNKKRYSPQHKPINWRGVEEKLAGQRKTSSDWLFQALLKE